MKVLAYIPLHYGAEYLEAAIKSVLPCVDCVLILYTKKPSYGYDDEIECPDSEEALKDIAYRAAGDKIHWIDVTGMARQETDHRGIAFTYAQGKGFDQILAVDADEVWDTEMLKIALKKAAESPYRRINVNGWVHFWRSFTWACFDGFLPTRIYNLGDKDVKSDGIVDGRIYHFGYAQDTNIVTYKMTCHGHKSEIRPNWLKEKFLNWVPGIDDVHPVSIGLWNPVSFEKETLPQVLKEHPNYDKWMI